jgi:ABC-type Mn2+/Zn2+ transport system ATPase subunit
MKPLKFFVVNLKLSQLFILSIALMANIFSYISYLNAEKYINKNIDNFDTIFYNLIQMFAYILIYSLTTCVIITLGKLAVLNAKAKSVEILLKINLQTISTTEYNRQTLSLIPHSNNINNVINSLFIELPRKIMACYHFIIALYDLNLSIMVYCLITNLIFITISIILANIQKNLTSQITKYEIDCDIILNNLPNSIQTFKINSREDEICESSKIIDNKIFTLSSINAITCELNQITTNLSGHILMAIIAYSSSPMTSVANLLYGIRSSAKFVEKMMGIVDYLGVVAKQYESFQYFEVIQNLQTEKFKSGPPIKKIIIESEKTSKFQVGEGNIVTITGENGVGKTTMVLNFLNVAYLGSHSIGKMRVGKMDQYLWRNQVAFVNQLLPLTNDTVASYIRKIIHASPKIDLVTTTKKSLTLLNVNPIIIDELNFEQNIKELSGGQAKIVQIIAAVTNLLFNGRKIIIMDEPSNNLSVSKLDMLYKIIKGLRENNILVFIISHDNALLVLSNINIIL